MTRLSMIALAGALLATPTQAEIPFAYEEALSTRYGEIHVVGQGFEFNLWHNQEPLPLPQDARWWAQWSAEGEGAYDWVLAAHHHGGNACGGGYYLLRLDADGVDQSPEISDCDGRLLDIRTGDGWIELDRKDRDIRVSLVTIRWQGANYSETFHYAPPAPPAGAGADVTRWIGVHGFEILQDASERARFATVMAPAEMQDLAMRLSVGSGVRQEGDWVVATGCMAHSCGLEMGALGIRISDGAVAAIIRSQGLDDRVYGLGDDRTFRNAVAEGLQ
ncbi:hypothetical protein [Gymnodinialimonas ceratoperidinii]|uniref:Uncharacterized protein n=1 Tax=Gymnodinialimonas ceratoperidinii TaxID=2856823 RepID=A0A8F6YAS5_9RHOB|nr:hypothetical protein [Gymnodinialimonas ceratoperidinii]QXT39336.1 hypothetical protein KYE46_15630 [Gymnodinialimonas ceratoperidinii]